MPKIALQEEAVDLVKEDAVKSITYENTCIVWTAFPLPNDAFTLHLCLSCQMWGVGRV